MVLSVDDVVYDPRKSGNGMVDKLIVKNNKVASQTKIDGADTISFDREFAPILENFIETHKDFSFENARATINLTGFCGILGYRISSDNEKIARTEKAKAKVVVSKLKSLGYNFACHSYGHYHIKKVDTNYVKKDLLDWKQKIEPIIGKTDIFVFPYGEWEIATQTGLTQKQKLLCDYGFNLFLGVGMKNFYDYMPFNINIKDKILLWDRKNIDNYSLIHNQKYVSKLFDCEKILSSFSKQK